MCVKDGAHQKEEALPVTCADEGDYLQWVEDRAPVGGESRLSSGDKTNKI